MIPRCRHERLKALIERGDMGAFCLNVQVKCTRCGSAFNCLGLVRGVESISESILRLSEERREIGDIMEGHCLGVILLVTSDSMNI